MGLELLILLVLVLLSAFFSGVETALVSLSEIKVKSLVMEGKKGAAALSKLKSNPRRMIITILLFNNLVNIGASAFAAVVAIDLFGSTGLGIATAVMTFLILVFGEITPKTYAANNAVSVSLIVSRPLHFLSTIFSPIIIILEKIVGSLLSEKFVGQAKQITEAEFLTMLELSAKQKVLEKKEKEFIEGILEFNDIKVHKVMIPRVEMFSLPASMPIKKAVKEIIKKNFSRIPIFEKNADNIVGIVHLRDVLTAVALNEDKKSLKNISIDPLFVSEEEIISEVFKKFQKRNIHLAIAVDEFGGTAGLVTLEDLMEEIVGDIIDESDVSNDKIRRLNGKSIIADGSIDLDEVNDFFKVKLPIKEHYHTLNAYLLHQLKDIPSKGQKLERRGLIFEIEKASDKKILSVKITRKTRKKA